MALKALPPFSFSDLPGFVGVRHEDDAIGIVDDHATAELIADGIHVHPAALLLATQAMPHRTDYRCHPRLRARHGIYKLYQHDVLVSSVSARLSDGTLAGSLLTMEDAVRNMVELVGLPLETALPLATEVPARILGTADRKGKLADGYDSDVVVLSPPSSLPP